MAYGTGLPMRRGMHFHSCRNFWLTFVGKRAFSEQVKPFSEIPGPLSLPLVGTLWKYIPFFGPYRFDRLDRNGALKLREYGPVVKEEIVPGEPVVWIFKPEDVQELLRREGRFPQRRSHLAIQHLRLKKPEKYNSGGLLPTNGPEWWRLRSALQKGLSSPQNVKLFIPQVNAVLNDFVNYVHNTQALRPTTPMDFLPDLSRLFLEILGIVAFNSRLDSFSPKELERNSRSCRLIDAALEANSCILRTDNGPQLWRYFSTPLYTRLQRAHDIMELMATEFIELNKKELEMKLNRNPSGLIQYYLLNSELDDKDVLGMAVDMILAGVDTTTYTSSFALYHLARHPEKQARLYEECKKVLADDAAIDSSKLASCHYVKAVLKETLRLNPVSVGVGRVLDEDAVFSGYHVPKKTVVVTQSQVVCRQAEFFDQPDSFIPERWLKGTDAYKSVSPYLSLPFGHGARTCIARRLAEQNIQLLLLKIVSCFELEWAGSNTLDIRSLLINKPDGPLLLRFKLRDAKASQNH